mgnify:FL=1|jgi:PAS domain S-box
MMKSSLKILLLEDNPDDALMVQRLLQKSHPDWQCRHATNKQSYLEALDSYTPDVILSDNNLPQFAGTDALRVIQERNLFIPFILVTGAVSDEFAANIIKLGADDYVLKDRLTRLPAAIEAAVKQREIERQRREAVQNLIDSEKKYRSIFTKSPLPNWIFDCDTLEFLEVNEAAIRHYGYSEEEFLSMSVLDIRPPEDRDKLIEDLKKIQTDPDVRRGNWRHVRKNGEIIIVEITAHGIPYKGRNARMVTVHDVTEQVKTAQEKAFASNNLSALINNTEDLMWSVDTDFRLITSNEAFNRMVERLGKRLKHGENVLAPQFGRAQLSRYKEFYERAFLGEQFTIIERFDEPISYYAEVSFYPIRQGNQVIGTACFSRDITQRKKAEEELRTMEKELADQKVEAQKKVTRAIIEGQEKERNHIGKELHDNVNQILASAKMYLGMAAADAPDYKELINHAMDLIQTTIQEIRNLTSGYVAPLKDINLKELVEVLLDKMRHNSHMQISFTCDLLGIYLHDELKLNLYRIVQEQLNNIIKHAQATQVNITITADEQLLYLVVADNGRGFDPQQKRKGIGISNVINRVELFNGEVNIDAATGKGCKIYIRIPRKPEAVVHRT